MFKSKTLLLVSLVALAVMVGFGWYVYDYSTDIKSRDQSVQGGSAGPNVFTLASSKKDFSFTSKPFRADFEFNAIAPHWEEENANDTNRSVYVRVSDNGEDWTDWLDVNVSGPLRDNMPQPNQAFSETPIIINGRYFQYKIELFRSSLSQSSPFIRELKINYINSEASRLEKGLISLRDLLFPSASADGSISVISRKSWGSPDPYGHKFAGTNKFWPSEQSEVTQVFVHHTATSSQQSEPKAVVRAIWDYHANTLGWGDIGYNYLVDSSGNVYEGRFGGDNTVAGHVYKYNKGSLGVAVLGCFESTSSTCDELNDGNTTEPSHTVIDNLSNLLSWKTTSFGINPKANHTFCNVDGEDCLNLSTISAHKDAAATSCNGDLFYQKMSNIRDRIASKNSNGWGLAAKQLSYDTASVYTDPTPSVTLSFKNKGTKTWENSGDRMLLRTANPDKRKSGFKASDWLRDDIPAVLNETSVDPGGTGTFTFDIESPSTALGTYYENFRLFREPGNDFKNYFTLKISVACSFGEPSNPRPNGAVIRNAGNNKIFWLEDGKKRHIKSPIAAETHRINLSRRVNVAGSELASLTTGEDIQIAEGTLLKVKNKKPIYIIDKTDSGYVKRHIADWDTFETFDLDNAKRYLVSQSLLDSYSDGPILEETSAIPDGLVVKSSGAPEVYLVEGEAKRHISNQQVFVSHRFTTKHVRQVDQAKIDSLSSGTAFADLRIGTVTKLKDQNKTYLTDITDGTKYRRWITTPKALTSASFRWGDKVEVSSSILDQYTDDSDVICHQ